jgi:hypothetical protein
MSIYGGPDIITDGLILHLDAANSKSYPGTGTSWFDLSGSNNHGTLVNGPIYSGINNGSIYLDTTNDYINLPITNSMRIDQGSFTIIVAHQIVTFGDNYGNFFYQSGGSGGSALGQSIFFQINFGILSLDFYGGGTTHNFGSNTFVNGSLVFIAVIFDRVAQTSVFFRNGVFSTSKSNSSVPNFSSLTSTQIGRRYQSGYKDLAGYNYFTQVYNKKLTQNEVLQNYNALKGRFGL